MDPWIVPPPEATRGHQRPPEATSSSNPSNTHTHTQTTGNPTKQMTPDHQINPTRGPEREKESNRGHLPGPVPLIASGGSTAGSRRKQTTPNWCPAHQTHPNQKAKRQTDRQTDRCETNVSGGCITCKSLSPCSFSVSGLGWGWGWGWGWGSGSGWTSESVVFSVWDSVSDCKSGW